MTSSGAGQRKSNSIVFCYSVGIFEKIISQFQEISRGKDTNKDKLQRKCQKIVEYSYCEKNYSRLGTLPGFSNLQVRAELYMMRTGSATRHRSKEFLPQRHL